VTKTLDNIVTILDTVLTNINKEVQVSDLRKLRQSNNFTMVGFARQLGISQSYVQKIEYGIVKPSRRFMELLLMHFPEVDIKAMFFDSSTQYD